MSESWEPYRVICDADALREAFCDRVEDLNVSRIGLDEAGDFTPGYAAKLLCDPPMKRIATDSLDKMLRATGTVLVMVVDDARFATQKVELQRRKNRVSRPSVVPWLFTSKNARQIGKKALSRMTPAQLKRHQRKAGKASARARRRKREAQEAEISALPESIGLTCSRHGQPTP